MSGASVRARAAIARRPTELTRTPPPVVLLPEPEPCDPTPPPPPTEPGTLAHELVIEGAPDAGSPRPEPLTPPHRAPGVPTPAQARVIGVIRLSIEERGCAPTAREIAAALGLASVNAVNDHLRALEKKGLLTHEPRRARTLRLTEGS